MKILWVCNCILPEASTLINEKAQPFGGWLVMLSRRLATQANVQLYIAFPYGIRERVRVIHGSMIDYFAFSSREDTEREQQIDSIIDIVKPDLLHVWGTEYRHAYEAIKSFGKPERTMVNIQGLVSVIARHYGEDLPPKVLKRYTFRDFLKRDNIVHQKKRFEERGKLEIAAITMCQHAIGRTGWDHACVSQINPGIRYHYCPEILRESFYEGEWNLAQCERKSIFISQGEYPIKGLHVALEALSMITARHPDTLLYIAGNNFSMKKWYRRSSYEKFLLERINKYGLSKNVVFTGILSEAEMCDMYKRTHVFLSPSILENESNSLSEAKMLGVPCVASYVGGVTDRIASGVDGFLYPYDEPYMAVHFICEIFSNDNLASTLGTAARRRALQLHDVDKNTGCMVDIYDSVAGK